MQLNATKTMSKSRGMVRRWTMISTARFEKTSRRCQQKLAVANRWFYQPFRQQVSCCSVSAEVKDAIHNLGLSKDSAPLCDVSRVSNHPQGCLHWCGSVQLKRKKHV